jgi:hypothetical protein
MKLLTNDYKVVDYFGVQLSLEVDIKYLVTTAKGEVIASLDMPDLDPEIGWLYDWDAPSVCIADVDLEGMDWKDTLMEVK